MTNWMTRRIERSRARCEKTSAEYKSDKSRSRDTNLRSEAKNMYNTTARVCALLIVSAVVAVWAFNAGASASTGGDGRGTIPSVSDDARNPLLAEWTGPYGGFPAFDRVKVSDF